MNPHYLPSSKAGMVNFDSDEDQRFFFFILRGPINNPQISHHLTQLTFY